MKNAGLSKVVFIQDMSDHEDSFAEDLSNSDLTSSSDDSLIIFDNELIEDITEITSEYIQDDQTQDLRGFDIDAITSYLKPTLYHVDIAADVKDALAHYILSNFTYDPPIIDSDYEIYDDICDFLFNEGQDIENYNDEYLIDFLVYILGDAKFPCRYGNIVSQFIVRKLLYDQILEFDQLDQPVNKVIYEKVSDIMINNLIQFNVELKLVQLSAEIRADNDNTY